ncbi:MAG: DegT/DnrJ/EryC1/StrS family aminotransferase [Burkholderiales bacterium]
MASSFSDPKSEGSPTAARYPIPPYRQSAYAQDISLPITEKAAREVVSLPMHADLDQKTQETIGRCIERNL